MIPTRCQIGRNPGESRIAYLKIIICALLVPLCAGLAGCGWFELGSPSLKSPDASLKIPAIKQAAEKRDRAAIPALIRGLDSTDPAIRFYSAYALRKITGRRFGYEYYAPAVRRQAAILRWQRWATTQLKPTSAGGGS